MLNEVCGSGKIGLANMVHVKMLHLVTAKKTSYFTITMYCHYYLLANSFTEGIMPQ